MIKQYASTPQTVSSAVSKKRNRIEKMQRIQRKRSMGWKMPANAIYVGRPTKWGNPYSIGRGLLDGKLHYWTREEVIQAYIDWLHTKIEKDSQFLDELAGKDLVCWCPLEVPCHADVIIKLFDVSPPQTVSSGVSEPS